MDAEDDFPFDSVDAFEKAVHDFYEQRIDLRREPIPMFAVAPPIHVLENINQPGMKILGDHMEECRIRSPSTKNTSALRELTEEVHRIEQTYKERLYQLESLYFYLLEKIKQLEKKEK